MESLIKAKKKDRKLIIKNHNLINYVCQGVYNILHGKIPINKETRQKLFRFRSKFHALCGNNHSSEEKIKIFNQTEGFLKLVVPSHVSGS